MAMRRRRCLCVGFSSLAYYLIAVILDALQLFLLLLVIHAEVIGVIIIFLVDICRREVVIGFILLTEFIL